MDQAQAPRLNDRHKAEAADAGDESGLAKLIREAEVLLGGTARGIATGVEEARNDPWDTGLKLAGSIAVGAGLAYLQRGAGMTRLAAEVVGAAMGAAFITDVAGPGRLEKLGGALRDTWNSSKNIEHNKAVIGQNLGRFAFDTGLMVVGGGVGSLCGRSTFRSKLTLSEPGPLSRTLDSQLMELSGKQGVNGSRSLIEPLGGSAHLETRISELPGATRNNLVSDAEFVVQATDPGVPSSRGWSDETVRPTESRKPGLDRKARPVVPEVKITSADPASMKDIPARDVLAHWDVRDVGDPEILARRQVQKRSDGRIVSTTSGYGEVTEFEYGVQGLYEVLTGVKFPDGTVARLFKGERWFVSAPGKPTSEWWGRMAIQPDGSLIKLPNSGGSETIFLNGLRELSITDGDYTRLVQDLRGRTLKTTTEFSDRIAAYEYDGGDIPVRAFEGSDGKVTEVPVADSKK